ncbi:MAG: aminotransferase class V-fold PLP-dependent enzyme [Bacteroidia bacterium]|nr:aminotransferase class V-fold PLP-dependent enzyme [Bacteroidia bacterium]
MSHKHLFNLDPEVVYLNCAYMSPLLREVEEAGMDGVMRKRSPNRISTEDFFAPVKVLKEEFAKLINGDNYERVAIIPSVSYGIGIVTRNIPLKKGEKILIMDEQFPSNVFGWQKLAQKTGAEIIKVAPPKVFQQRGERWNERILAAIDSRTRVVSLPHFHWSDGTRFDLEAIRKKTWEVGAKLIIDGTQSVGAYPFDINRIQPDAMFAGGYKWLMGPYGLGLAWLGEYFDDKEPLEENWINRLGSEDFSSLARYESSYQPFARRYDMGEQSNFILVPMLTAALRWLNRTGVDFIQNYCRELTAQPLEKLSQSGYQIESPEWRGSHLFGIYLPDRLNIHTLKQALEKEKIYVSVRGESLRVSPHLYNETPDLEKLVAVLEEVYAKYGK